MKTLAIIILSIVIVPLGIHGQKQIQIKNQRFDVYGVKSGVTEQRSTKQYMVELNYETGEFIAAIDMQNIRLIPDSTLERTEKVRDYFRIEGFFPINKILYDKNTDQQYQIELNIINQGKTFPAIFDFIVKNYTGTGNDFHYFNGTATINLEDFIKEGTYGFDPQIKISISFQAYIIGG
ncbi:MAG: hypothetical protein KKA81_06060 [Bacteroidetes bacterium]|nr:hypothetical protein [Bacteroidota bacterium]